MPVDFIVEDAILEYAGHKNESKKKMLKLAGSLSDSVADELLKIIRESRVDKKWVPFQ